MCLANGQWQSRLRGERQATSTSTSTSTTTTTITTTIQQYYSVFDLLPRLLPPMTCVKPNPDAIFGWAFHQKMDPHFLMEAHPKTISENASLKNRHFRVYKIAKQDLVSENVQFLFRIRYYKRWPHVTFFKTKSRCFRSLIVVASIFYSIFFQLLFSLTTFVTLSSRAQGSALPLFSFLRSSICIERRQLTALFSCFRSVDV